MTVKVGINGFGRIGRLVFRAGEGARKRKIVAINDLVDAKTNAHLLKYDSVHGTRRRVTAGDDIVEVGGRRVKVFAERDPSKLPWGDLGVDIVIESTGFSGPRRRHPRTLQAAQRGRHHGAGQKRGHNNRYGESTGEIRPGKPPYHLERFMHQQLPSACERCLWIVRHQARAYATVHSYTSDQRILDLAHSDLRRARAAGMSLIPTTTGAASAVALVLPELKGKLNGFAMRVPTPNVSVVDFVADLEKKATAEDVNNALRAAAEGPLSGILAYTQEELVSHDFNHNPHSSIVDGLCTTVIDGDMAKVIAWYDNEWGYSNRVVDLASYIAKFL